MPTTTRRRFDSLTGLRWFAALAVFARHVGRGGALNHLTVQGVTGVSFFFILSGFVMTWSRKPEDTARAFYQRRFARIYPAFLVSVLLGCVINSATVTPLHLLLVTTSLESWVPKASAYWAINDVCWSLSCETFFYLVFPAIHRLLAQRSQLARRRLLVTCLALAIIIPLGVHSSSDGAGLGFWFIYIFPPVRLIEFIIGMLLAFELSNGTRIRLPLPAAMSIAAAAYVVAGFVPVYLMWVAVTLIPWILLISAAACADVDGRPSLFRHRALVRLGEWSYCFYLLHQLIIVGTTKVRAHFDIGGNQFVWIAAELVAAIAASAALHYAVERPLERRLRPAPQKAPSLD